MKKILIMLGIAALGYLQEVGRNAQSSDSKTKTQFKHKKSARHTADERWGMGKK